MLTQKEVKESSQNRFLRGYEKAFADIGLLPVFSAPAREQMAQMVENIARSNANINAILGTNQHIGVKAGFIAEEAHAESFNLDAILRHDSARAYTDRYDEWYNLKLGGEYLKTNDRPDVVIAQDGHVTHSVQAKYYATPETTTREMSQVKDGAPKYEGQDQLLGPSDQVHPTGDVVSIQEHAEAKAAALHARDGNPVEAQAYEQTAQKATDVVTNGHSSSAPLTKADADALGSGDKTSLEAVRSHYQTASTLQQMGSAAVNAAALSAVISGVANSLVYLTQAYQGKMSYTDASYKIMGEMSASAADSAIKAAAASGVQSLLVRYGTEEFAADALAHYGFQEFLSNGTLVSTSVGCGINLIKDLCSLYQGNITQQQLYERQGKALISTSARVVGHSLGTSLGTSLASSLGMAAGPMALAGGLAGGMIVGLALNMAIENGIEKPYKALVENTENLKAATQELERVSQRVFQGQILFTKYIEAEYQLDKAQQTQFTRIDAAGARALDAINQL